jgi:hypothetical protein
MLFSNELGNMIVLLGTVWRAGRILRRRFSGIMLRVYGGAQKLRCCRHIPGNFSCGKSQRREF